MTIFQAKSQIVNGQKTVVLDPQNPGELTNVKVLSNASLSLRQNYRPTNQVLGEGTFGKVFVFTSRSDEEPAKKYAVKVLLKQTMQMSDVQDIRGEIQVLSMMDHENIIKYVESFEDNRYMYIVTEFVESSRSLATILTETIDSWDQISPILPVNDVRKLMKMTLSGVLHIH